MRRKNGGSDSLRRQTHLAEARCQRRGLTLVGSGFGELRARPASVCQIGSFMLFNLSKLLMKIPVYAFAKGRRLWRISERLGSQVSHESFNGRNSCRHHQVAINQFFQTVLFHKLEGERLSAYVK